MAQGRMGSIERYLLPARVRVEYNENPNTGKPERVCYIECANGEVLTGNIPFGWAQYICKAINLEPFRQGSKASLKDPIAVLRIEGLPMQKTEAKIIGLKDGVAQMQDSPAYVNSIKLAGAMGEDLFMMRWTQLPITIPITISCTYFLTGNKQYSLPLCNAWVLDLLYGLSIIKSAGHRIVKSMDGSGFEQAKDQPHTIVKIRKWV